MPRLTGRVLRGAAVVAALAFAYAMGAGAGGTGTRAPEHPWHRTVGQAAAEVARAAPDPGRERVAVEKALRRMGDRWARFYTAAEFSGLEDTLNGWYSGVGLWLEKAGEDAEIVGVQPGSP